MPFECKKYHGQCGAHCCGIVPIPLEIWEKNQNKIQKRVIDSHKAIGTKDNVQKTFVLPITEDYLCPFLQDDLQCAIYEDRPEVCRKYGDESALLLCCPMQKACGTPRTPQEQSKLESDIHKTMVWERE